MAVEVRREAVMSSQRVMSGESNRPALASASSPHLPVKTGNIAKVFKGAKGQGRSVLCLAGSAPCHRDRGQSCPGDGVGVVRDL